MVRGTSSLRYLGPALLGRKIATGREVPALLARVREHRMAKGALENAAWDAEAQEKGIPLWKLLGGAQREIYLRSQHWDPGLA